MYLKSCSCLLVVVLLAATAFSVPPVRSEKPSANQQQPIARIERIVVDDEVVAEPNIYQVAVVRASGGVEIPGKMGLLLYANDRVRTGLARIVLTSFLDSNQKTGQVTLGERTSVEIRPKSVFVTLGQLWVKVAGTFAVRTVYWTLGVPGTEFYVEVNAAETGSEKTNLSVFEGAVDVRRSQTAQAVGRYQQVTMREQSRDSEPKNLLVKGLYEVDLDSSEPLPKAARPLTAERIKYLKGILAAVETARTAQPARNAPSATAEESDGWKIAEGMGLRFAVPKSYSTAADGMPGHISDGISAQNFLLRYLTATDPQRVIFAASGYGDIRVAPTNKRSMEQLAAESVSRILRQLSIPGVGIFILDLDDAEVGKLKTMGMAVSETTAISQETGREYRVYFALAFQPISGTPLARMTYFIVGCREGQVVSNRETIVRILASFQPPRTSPGVF